MRKLVILTLAATAILAATPAMATPFGHLDGPWNERNSVTGVIGVTGWALDINGVRWVDVFVDDRSAGRAFYGMGRPGVTARFPGFPDSSFPGFGFFLDTTHFFNGRHTIRTVVTSIDGTTRFLNPLTVEFMNTTHLLAPFGELETPNNHAVLQGVCNLDDPFRRFTVVTGFALDVGVERGDRGGTPGQGDPPGDSGVGYVELLIDGSIFASSKISCFNSAALGGLSNCYGLPRLDIESSYPDVPDAPHSGFRFVLDVGALIALGYSPGSHVLTIRAGDISGQVANIDEDVFVFACGDLGNQPSFGFIDSPKPIVIYSGTITVTGWALDFEGVERIEVFADGQLMGVATHGITRPGVTSRFPGFPDSAGPGFTFSLDTTLVADDWVDIIVRVTDIHGRQTIIGERTIFVDNLVGE